MIDPVISEIASAIHVRHIQTPIEHARETVSDESQAEVRTFLELHHFDAAPVFGDDVDGWILRDDLDPRADLTVGAARRELTANVLIDASAPLAQLLDRFTAGHRFLFVVGAPGITGIVTPSDMNKQAGRTHLFMELSALELALAQTLRSSDEPEELWMSRLSNRRAKDLRRRHESKRLEDDDADLIAALDFRDLLFIHRDEYSSDAWCGLRGADGVDRVESLAKFRNSVVHAVLEVTTDVGPRIDELIKQAQVVSELLRPFVSKPT